MPAADAYVPGHGNRRFGVRAYDLDLDYRIATNHLSARAVLEIEAAEPLDQVALDLYGLTVTASAQSTRYGEITVPAVASGEELSSQPELWVMEMNFKPMRQIVVELTDPVTGKKLPQHVWYIAYRAINRKLANRAVANAPVNELDAPGCAVQAAVRKEPVVLGRRAGVVAYPACHSHPANQSPVIHSAHRISDSGAVPPART